MNAIPDFFSDLEPAPSRVRHFAETTSDRVAITSLDTGHSLTWAELYRRGLEWADALCAVGVSSGSSVATLLHQSLTASSSWLGVVQAGALEFPVNPEYKGDWLIHALRTAQAEVVIVDVALVESVRAVLAQVPVVRLVVVCHGDSRQPIPGLGKVAFIHADEFLADAKPREDVFQPGLHDLGCAVFTSGTTGASKAVAMPWGQLSAFAALKPNHEDVGRQVYFVPFRPFHLSGKGALLRPAHSGARSVIREKLSVSKFWDDVRTEGITWIWMVPLHAHALHRSPVIEGELDNSLEWTLVGPSVPFIDELKERFGFGAYSTYGMTETSNFFYLPPERTTSANYRASGRPAPGFEAIVADEFDGELPQGEAGELLVRSSRPWLLNQGYIGQPEASFKAWRNGWFHTGDKFRVNADGEYEFLDRMKDALRTRGENVSSLELEDTILKSDGVKECAVIGVPADIGEDEILLAVVPEDGHELDLQALVDDITTRVPGYAVPRYVRILDILPRTQATDRVQKYLLRQHGVTADTWDRLAARESAVV